MKLEGGMMVWIILLLAAAMLVVVFMNTPKPAASGAEAEKIDNQTICTQNSCSLTQLSSDTIKIASWNLQVFGRSKAENDTLMASYADIMSQYDIIVALEIRDSTGDAFKELCSQFPGYACFTSKRFGRSSNKEQYGLIYKFDKITFVGDTQDDSESAYAKWERPPIVVELAYKNWSFDIIIAHLDPDVVEDEMEHLQDMAYTFLSDAILIGDLNADCDYYDTPPEELTFWQWVVPDDADTTSSSTDCAYDRIIINNAAKDNFISYGIYTGITLQQSDHYLIWGEFKP